MLAALQDAGIRPDLVLGTSIGAINGVFVAADPDGAAKRLEAVWRSDVVRTAFRSSLFGRLGTLARSGTHLHSNLPLRRLLEEHLPERRFDELAVPFQCVAASVERAAAHWFDQRRRHPGGAGLGRRAGPAAAGTHRWRALLRRRAGAQHPGRPGGAAGCASASSCCTSDGSSSRSSAPRRPWEVGLVAFEIARRHRFVEEMASLPDDVTVHVLPAGGGRPGRPDRQLRYRDHSRVDEYIDRARTATAAYLSTANRPD